MNRGVWLWIVVVLGVLQLVAQTSSSVDGGAGFGVSVGERIAIHANLPTPIVGAPYCANTEDESDRPLADGNHIRRESKGRVCRDSQGRVYTERQFANGPLNPQPMMITIQDPVGGTEAMLNPDAKSARVRRHAVAMQTFSEHEPAQIGGMVALQPRPNVMARTIRPETTDLKMRPRSQTEDLGAKIIEGLSCHGRRMTMILPPEYMGNEKPLKRSTETWLSDDIHLPVLVIIEGDDSGRNVHRLTNIVLGEPDPSIFQIPAGYKVIEGK